MIAKKSWLDKLRGKIVKMEGHKKRDKVMKNNSIFQKVEGSFQKKTNERSKYKGQVPTIDKFTNFWPGIWEDERETTNKKQMEKIKESMKDKI